MTYEDFKMLTTRTITEDIARRLDPKAFKNPDRADMARRKEAVLRVVSRAMNDFRRRELSDCSRTEITNEDIPW